MKISECSDRPILSPCSLESANYQVDPYVGCAHCCHYCYVLDKAETDWEQEIRIHKNIADRLREALSGIDPQTIYMGYETDPYQPGEAESRQTRMVLELLLEMGFSARLLTKSNLVCRDADLLREMDGAGASVSVAFNDDRVRRLFEGNTMDTEVRIEALRQLHAAGIRTGALVCPVIPYITDPMRLVDALAPHTDTIWIYGLSVSESTSRGWKNVQRILDTHFPDSTSQIQDVILDRDHAYWTELREKLAELQEERQLDFRIRV